jgi:hypothetical protein
LAYFRTEGNRHADLLPSGNQKTESQRAEAFRLQHSARKEVVKILELFDCTYQMHTLTMLREFVVTKEEIIRKAMTRADIYPTPAGMSAVAAPIAEQLPAADQVEHSVAVPQPPSHQLSPAPECIHTPRWQ